MQITTEQFTQAVEKWIDNDLANKGSVWQKGLLVFLVNQGRPKLEQLLNSMQIVADSQGKFDVDNLHKNMKLALNKMGDRATIPLINYTFDEVDLDKIFGYLEGNYGQSN